MRVSSLEVGCHLFERTYGWIRNHIRSEVAVERREGFRLGGRKPVADVAIRADHDHATRREPRADGIDTGVV